MKTARQLILPGIFAAIPAIAPPELPEFNVRACIAGALEDAKHHEPAPGELEHTIERALFPRTPIPLSSVRIMHQSAAPAVIAAKRAK